MSGVFTEADLLAAVRGGVLDAATAQALRDFVARSRAPSSDEEQFRLLSGFNDIFVTIAAVLTLFAVGWLGALISNAAGCALIAVAAWGLAEFFTRRRRMALPSIVLMLAFVGGVAGMVLLWIGIGQPSAPGLPPVRNWIPASAGAAAAALAAYAHWRRFRVPITVAAATLAVLGTLIAILLGNVPSLLEQLWWLLAAAGLGVFAFAMWWDMDDRDRVTRRTDVAFWLHLAAAPLIVHPMFRLLGLLGPGVPTTGSAVAAIAIYLLLTVVALIIDRRALLVSALAYVLFATFYLLRNTGSVGTSVAIATLAIGGMLLLLSALWPRARAVIVRLLPVAVQARLPRA